MSSLSFASTCFMLRMRFSSVGYMNSSNSFQVTSHFPIQNGEISSSRCGPSSGLWPDSDSALPILNLPPGIGSISKVTSVPAMESEYFCISLVFSFCDVATT